MGELKNCPICNNLFVKTNIRDVCDSCYKKEEVLFDKVYAFVRQSKNRTSTVEDIVEATGVEEGYIYKWIRNGRLRPTQFPNIGYPCQTCGKPVTSGKICANCAKSITKELESHEKEQERQRRSKEHVYKFER